jgi:hypothetical protein
MGGWWMLGSQGKCTWVGWRERRETPVEGGRIANHGPSAGSIQIWVTRNRPPSLLCDAELALGGNRTRQVWLPCDSDKVSTRPAKCPLRWKASGP